MGTFGFEFPVVVDDVIAANPDHPCHERARFRPVRIECPERLQEYFLSQVLGFIKSSGEAVGQVIDPLRVLPDYVFPGTVFAAQAPFHQLRIGCLQRVSAPSASATSLPHFESTRWREEKFQNLVTFLR